MNQLSDVLNIELNEAKQKTLKQSFMPYTENINVDGYEKEALTVLLNLSISKPICNNWLDDERAKLYFGDPRNIDNAVSEIKWFHTHNLKFPDCRVKDQRIIAQPLPTNELVLSSFKSHKTLGWSHNSAVYKHTIWLLNEFKWQGRNVNLLGLLVEDADVWIKLLNEFGFSLRDLTKTIQLQNQHLPVQTFPEDVSSRSKQVRFPCGGNYLSVTPVVSHSIQRQLELKARDKNSTLKFINLSFPNPASIGNLCGSLGGNMKVLNYPIGVSPRPDQTLIASRKRTGRFLDDYQITNKRMCSVFNHLIGKEPLKNQKQRQKARFDQTKILRKQIARWLLPLVELRDRMDGDVAELRAEHDELVVQAFLSTPEIEMPSLAMQLNQHLHLTLQNNQFTRKFAYHPKLMLLLKSQIEWILNQLSSPQKDTESTGDEQFIYLSKLRIEDAVALSNPYLSGAPSLTGIWGFMHQYQREFNQLNHGYTPVEFVSFSIFVHSEKITKSAKLAEFNSVALKRKISQAKRATTRTEMLSDLVIDIVIKVRTYECLSDHHSKLKAALPSRFCGGNAFQPLIENKQNWFSTFSNRTDLFQVVKSLPHYGRWLVALDEQPTTMDELERVLVQDPSLIPIANGYHLLETPKGRFNSITDEHAYAENTIGVAKRVSPIEVRLTGYMLFFTRNFWSLMCTKETILIEKYKN